MWKLSCVVGFFQFSQWSLQLMPESSRQNVYTSQQVPYVSLTSLMHRLLIYLLGASGFGIVCKDLDGLRLELIVFYLTVYLF